MDNQQQGYYTTDCDFEVKQIPTAKYYYASKCGRIFSKKTGVLKEIKPYWNKGYLALRIVIDGVGRRGMQVHRLIAMAYIPNPDDKKQVNHINGIKHDNRVENLEWASGQENMDHAYAIGLVKSIGEDNPKNILKEDQVLDIYNRCLQGHSRKALAIEFNVSESAIKDIITRKNWGYLTNKLRAVEIRGKSKNLDDDTVELICSMLQEGVKNCDICKTIGFISKYVVSDIKNRRSYTHISRNYAW